MLLTTNDSIRFSFDTEGIDVRALAKILQETYNSFRDLSDLTNQQGDFKIYPFKQGSFEFVLATFAVGTSVLTVGTSVITLFREVLSYKKSKLEFQKARLQDSAKNKGNLDSDRTIISNPTINLHVSVLLKTISEHTGGLKIKDPNEEKEIIKITTSEIKQILEIEDREREREKPETQTIEKDQAVLH